MRALRLPCPMVINPWTVGLGHRVRVFVRVFSCLQRNYEETRTVVSAASHDIEGTK